jgi:hypothetical protein
VLNRNFHSNVNVLGRFYKQFLTSLYRSTLFGIFLFNKGNSRKDLFSQFVSLIRYYYMTFSISALVLARDSHIKPDSEAGVLIWVEGWYQGSMLGKGQCKICDKKIMTWNFPYRPWYQPSTHINTPASLSGLIWESRANTRADMEKFLFNTTYTFELIIPFQVI